VLSSAFVSVDQAIRMDESQDADQRSFQRSYSQQQAARIKTKFKTQVGAVGMRLPVFVPS
jgi:hypothetical protein